MIKMVDDVTPQSLIMRIINFMVVLFLLVIAPLPLAISNNIDNVWVQILCVILMLLFYSGLGWYVYFLLKKNIEGPIFTKPNIRNWRGLWWLVGMLFLMIIVEGILAQLRIHLTGVSISENQAAINELTSSFSVTMVGMVIYGVLFAPVVEEMIFRGLILNYFFRKNWWWGNVILSGMIFALPHMGNIPTNLADTLSFVIYATMGMILAYVYKKTGELRNSIAIHMINNGLSMIPILIIATEKALH
ncbi:CAAX protease family protein [Leuconostoc litchii]|uniref:CPBP family intramembrane metalloprotease n=1 Tax=Leuconostoc litchii TaxID=1981069 RepID=A0A6P2CR94_9LACO|nr:type II CAAX endopeptidase family protein [Leuconostoc litchii]TYC47381.1 CPBP family intramembrane metalloprotease [Leuconostoc litchii]GMA69391.1 CAAX protease family protein [Leuconostoc litchii]